VKSKSLVFSTVSYSRPSCRYFNRYSTQRFQNTATVSDLGAERMMPCARRRDTSSKGTDGWQMSTWPGFSTESITTF
jgi:hypothetical protein